MDVLKNIFREIKERRIRRWLAIYISSSLTIIYLINLITNRYNVPNFVFDYALLIVIFGFFSIIIFAWFHGKEGKQNFSWKELIAHSIVVLAAFAFVLFIRKTPSEQNIVVESNSIAVLPFNNLSDSKEDEYFSDGITEDILTNLSKIKEIKVISRTSTMKYKNAEKNIREIGSELGVATILEGSVRRSGNRLRIAVQLIDVSSDKHLWSDTYDRELKDIFDIQTDVAARIAASLRTELSLKEKNALNEKPTNSIDAYAYYLKGRELYNQYRITNNEEAIEMFKKAIDIDPKYALAYAGLADAYAQLSGLFEYEQSWLDSSIKMSEKALQLNDGLAEAYKSLGVAYVYQGKFRAALKNYYKAVELNANYAPAVSNIASMHWWLGEYDDAFKWAVRGIKLDPARASSYGTLGLVYAGLTLDSASEKWTKTAIDLHPTSGVRHGELIRLYLAKGDYDKARNYIENILSSQQPTAYLYSLAGDIELFDNKLIYAKAYFDSSFALSKPEEKEKSAAYAYVLWKEGKKNIARKFLSAIIRKDEEDAIQRPADFNTPYELARVNSIIGEKKEALNWLRKAIESGWRFYRFCINDPLLENLRGDSEFNLMNENVKKLVETMKEKVLENN